MIALLRDALGFIRPEPAVPGPLRVVDLGAGAGEGYTRERVRQIESAALSKLRQPKLRHKLREYLDEYVA